MDQLEKMIYQMMCRPAGPWDQYFCHRTIYAYVCALEELRKEKP